MKRGECCMAQFGASGLMRHVIAWSTRSKMKIPSAKRGRSRLGACHDISGSPPSWPPPSLCGLAQLGRQAKHSCIHMPPLAWLVMMKGLADPNHLSLPLSLSFSLRLQRLPPSAPPPTTESHPLSDILPTTGSLSTPQPRARTPTIVSRVTPAPLTISQHPNSSDVEDLVYGLFSRVCRWLVACLLTATTEAAAASCKQCRGQQAHQESHRRHPSCPKRSVCVSIHSLRTHTHTHTTYIHTYIHSLTCWRRYRRAIAPANYATTLPRPRRHPQLWAQDRAGRRCGTPATVLLLEVVAVGTDKNDQACIGAGPLILRSLSTTTFRMRRPRSSAPRRSTTPTSTSKATCASIFYGRTGSPCWTWTPWWLACRCVFSPSIPGADAEAGFSSFCSSNPTLPIRWTKRRPTICGQQERVSSATSSTACRAAISRAFNLIACSSTEAAKPSVEPWSRRH